MIIFVHTILDRSENKTVRLQYYWKLDKNIPHAAHHWGILFTSLTLTQGIKIFLSLEERYIILQFDFDFTNSPLSLPLPPPPPRNHRSFVIKGTRLCSPVLILTEHVTCRKKDAYLYNFCLEQGRKFIIGRCWPRVRLRWLRRRLGIGQVFFGRRHGRHNGVQNNETPAM